MATEKPMAMEQRAEELIEQVRDQIDDIESLIEGLDRRVQKLVAERPMVALGGTLLAGFLAGRLLSRR